MLYGQTNVRTVKWGGCGWRGVFHCVMTGARRRCVLVGEMPQLGLCADICSRLPKTQVYMSLHQLNASCCVFQSVPWLSPWQRVCECFVLTRIVCTPRYYNTNCSSCLAKSLLSVVVTTPCATSDRVGAHPRRCLALQRQRSSIGPGVLYTQTSRGRATAGVANGLVS